MNPAGSSIAELLAVPTGGGALRGLGEKFSPDLHTGTGNFSVPIAVPEGRNGLKPALSLIFSTGHGNGPFGLGWSLDIPAVTRLTSRGLPRYDGRDGFVLSGAEDLVEVAADPTAGVSSYRPRTEGLFAGISHYIRDGDYWRVETKDGLTSVYGQPAAAESAAPDRPAVLADPAAPARRFAWRLSETRDTFGNRVVYEYRRERDRSYGHDGVQIYPRRIRYVDLPDEGEDSFLVSVEFLYDDDPAPAGIVPEVPTRSRPDPCSEYRAGFEVRTARRCKWLVIRTHPGAGPAIPVRAYEFIYLDEQAPSAGLPANGLSLLARINVIGFDDAGSGVRELPPLDFGYSRFTPAARRFRALEGAALPAVSLAHPDLELVDLFGQGLPDILELGASGARYWRNLGGGRFDRPRPLMEAPAGLRLADPGVQILDAGGDGRADLLVTTAESVGDYPLDFGGRFNPRSFRRYPAAPSFDLEDPEVRLLDLTGDGATDVLRTGSAFECYFNNGSAGFAGARRIPRGRPEDFPNVSFSDPRVKLADLCGDGLQDIALVHRGRLDYWPNLGYGRFGARLTLAIPGGLPEGFDPARVLLGDVDGDGLADLLHVSDREVTLWLNRAGNGWSDPVRIAGTPSADGMVTVRLTDLDGSGVAGLLWTREARPGQAPRHYFLDFTGGTKPYLLNRMDNHLGAVTEVAYAPSTKFYLRDQAREATRWRSTLPFPVQVVERVTLRDALSGGTLATEYRYHHGYWDGVEREFRGFGMVEQLDSEVFAGYAGRGLPADGDPLASLREQRSYSPPLLTRTWFHQGAVDPADGGPWRELEFRDEYWPGDRDAARLPYLPEGGTAPVDHRTGLEAFLDGLPRPDRRDALRSLRGSILRRETYALDGSPLEDRPYSVAEYAYALREIDPPSVGSERRRIFFPHAVAERSTQWERGDDPLSRYSYSGDYDACGQPRRRLEIACPRGWRDGNSRPAAPYLASLSLTEYAAPPAAGPFLADRVIRTRAYELTGTAGAELGALLMDPAAHSLRLFAEALTYYDGPAFTGLAFGQIGGHGVPVRTEALVLTEARLDAAYGSERPPYLDPAAPFVPGGDYPQEFADRLPGLAGYVHHSASEIHAGGWYAETLRAEFDFQGAAPATEPRGLLLAQQDPLGNATRIAREDFLFGLLPLKVTGPTGLATQAEYSLRLLKPAQITDPNGNRTEVRYSPTGLVTDTFVRGKAGRGEGDLVEPSLALRYDFRAFFERGQPAMARTLRRVRHDSDPEDTGEVIESREYSDGFGRLLQSRSQGEAVRFRDSRLGSGELLPAGQGVDSAQPVTGRDNVDPARPNVVVSGWQVYDNKGRVVEKYEPFFDAGWDYVPPAGTPTGAKATLYYDAAGRVVRTVNPDGSEQRVVHGLPGDLADPPLSPLDTGKYRPSPWESFTYDANDNAGRTHGSDPAQAGYRHHYDTPVSAETDALGRVVRAVARQRGAPLADGTLPPIETHLTRSAYDIQGNLVAIRDALGRLAFEYAYDLAKRPLGTRSLDAGAKRAAFDAAGNAIESRDAKGALTLSAYDALNRPVRRWAGDGATDPVTLRERLRYGDDPGLAASAAATNRLGRLVRHDDEAGRVEVAAYDFRGNVLETSRRVLSDDFLLAGYRAELARPAAERTWAMPAPRVDWADNASEAALGPAYAIRSAYDALDRVVRSDYPEAANGERYRLRPAYNRAGALESVDLAGPLDAADQGPVQTFVQRIAYNAKGQRTLIAYGNGIVTRQAYDPLSFRLVRLRTERCAVNAAEPTSYRFSGALFQDIAYRYDLVGNLVGVQDRTPGCGVANNPEVLSHDAALRQQLIAGEALIRRFEYDPLYRLTAATGREAAKIASPRPWADLPRHGYGSGGHGTPDQDNAPELTALYREEYDYDAAGNLLTQGHGSFSAGTGWQTAWSRRFGMDGRTPDQWRSEIAQHGSGDWNGPPGNRLTHVEDRASGVPTPPAVAQSHWYDDNGNLVREHAERAFEWDHGDRMKAFRNQTGASRPTTYALYLYDAAGQRVKKLVVDGGNGYRTTTYLGGSFEIHTEQKLDGSGKAENCSLHVMDGESRIAIVRVGAAFADDGAGGHPVQYHLGDHLGSSVVVMSGSGGWINREEFFPYGETSFGSFGRKRYRFTGKERDEESGLSYHGARYYAPWLARWTACDPACLGPPAPNGTETSQKAAGPPQHDRLCRLYTYVADRPTLYFDPDGREESQGSDAVKNTVWVVHGFRAGERTGHFEADVKAAYKASPNSNLDFKQQPNAAAMKKTLSDAKPGDAVFMVGHGSPEMFQVKQWFGANRDISPKEIETSLGADGAPPDLVVFGACDSMNLADSAVKGGAKVAIGVTRVTEPMRVEEATIELMKALDSGKTVQEAVDTANTVMMRGEGNLAVRNAEGRRAVFEAIGDPELKINGVLTGNGLQPKPRE